MKFIQHRDIPGVLILLDGIPSEYHHVFLVNLLLRCFEEKGKLGAVQAWKLDDPGTGLICSKPGMGQTGENHLC